MSVLDDFDRLDEAALDAFIQTQQEENLHLDFKQINAADFSREDRRNLAKAISGFANSDGGVIIWGIDARTNSDGVDCASSKVPIAPLDRFFSRLNQLAGEAASPVVDGVRHRSIPTAHANDGFAATLVPPSDRGPHQAKLGEDRYFKRSGDRFVKMEHFDLEDMFGRRQRPVLSLTKKVIRGGEPGWEGSNWSHSVVLGVSNAGRGSAFAPMLAVQLLPPWYRRTYGIDGHKTEGLARLATADRSSWIRYGGSGLVVVHPGTELDVCAVTCRVRGAGAPPPDLRLHYQIAAENFRLIEAVLELSSHELLEEALRSDA